MIPPQEEGGAVISGGRGRFQGGRRGLTLFARIGEGFSSGEMWWMLPPQEEGSAVVCVASATGGGGCHSLQGTEKVSVTGKCGELCDGYHGHRLMNTMVTEMWCSIVGCSIDTCMYNLL